MTSRNCVSDIQSGFAMTHPLKAGMPGSVRRLARSDISRWVRVFRHVASGWVMAAFCA
jgi:hypothetical protein